MNDCCDSCVFQNLTVVVNVCVFEIKLSCGASSDERNRIHSVFVECLHYEGFTVGKSVDVKKCEGMIYVHAEWYVMTVDFFAHLADAFIYAHGNLSAAEVVIRNRYRHDVAVLNHAVREYLNKDTATVFIGLAV